MNFSEAQDATRRSTSMLAYIEHKNKAEARAAFDTAKRAIKAGALQMLDKSEINLSRLNAAMDDLEFLKPPLKKRFLQACVTCIAHDGKVGIPAYELTRTIASCLDCPMPPVLMNTSESDPVYPTPKPVNPALKRIHKNRP